MKRILLSAAIALALAPAAAAAKDKTPVFVEASAVKDKASVAFDPAKAYILVRSNVAMPLMLMKAPTPEDQAQYDRLRADAFAQARAKYAKKLARYQRDKAVAEEMAAHGTATPLPEAPIEPTEANFEFTAFDLLANVPIGPLNRFAKGDGGASTYLEQVTPGTYRVYGPVGFGNQGASYGTCFCMGSVTFEARAGEIVDLGMMHMLTGDEAKPEAGDSTGIVDSEAIAGYQFLQPAPVGAALDPRLAGQKVTPARFTPVGKRPNYYGLTIGRMPAMPGVMRYDRDRIVDLTAHPGS